MRRWKPGLGYRLSKSNSWSRETHRSKKRRDAIARFFQRIRATLITSEPRESNDSKIFGISPSDKEIYESKRTTNAILIRN
jgi:hypothetical protein